MKQYTAQVGPDNAARLEFNGADGAPVIEDIGGGTVRIADLDQLRARAHDDDGAITDDDDGLQIWIAGEGYPVFDDLDAAVAEAYGVLSHYDIAKREYDRQTALRHGAVTKVVELSGSVPEAAKLLEIDEQSVTDALGNQDDTPGNQTDALRGQTDALRDQNDALGNQTGTLGSQTGTPGDQTEALTGV